MSLRRREFIAGLGGAAAWPLAARAQRAEPVRRVGVLTGAAKDSPIQSQVAAFRERLAMLGWVEGGNLRMDYRFAEGDPDRFAAYAEEQPAKRERHRLRHLRSVAGRQVA